MQQLNFLSPMITSVHLDPPLISPALSIDDDTNAPSTKISKGKRKGIKEAGPRKIYLSLANVFYCCPFSGYESTYTAIHSLNRHKRDCPYNSKNQIKDYIDYGTALQGIYDVNGMFEGHVFGRSNRFSL